MALLKKNTIFLNLILVLTSFILAFVMLEMAIRIIYGTPTRYLEPQVRHIRTSYGYKLAANQKSYTGDKEVISNAQGFRDHDWEIPKPNNRIRIMALGDSMTFGLKIDFNDTFAKRLEKKLQSVNRNVEVLLAGISGWNTYDELDFLKDEGVSYKPDIVIYCFFYNDYGPRHISKRDFTNKGRVDERPAWLRWVPYKMIFFYKRSALISFVRIKLHDAQLNEAFFNQLIDNKIDLDNDYRISVTYSYIREMNELLKKEHIKLILMPIPSINYFYYPEGTVKYITHLKSFAESIDIPFIDISIGFRHKGNINLYYMGPWDNHLSPEGHKVVAEELFKELQLLITSNQEVK